MPVGRLQIGARHPRLLGEIVELRQPAHRRHIGDGRSDNQRRSGGGDHHLPFDVDVPGGTFGQIFHERLPVEVEMQDAGDDEYRAEDDVHVAPAVLGQPDQVPVRPVGDPPLRNHVKNGSGDDGDGKRPGNDKRRQRAAIKRLSFEPLLCSRAAICNRAHATTSMLAAAV